MKHVLVVEDDPMNAKLMEMILSRKGHYEVGITDDPKETLSRVRSGDVDLVIMDVSLKCASYEGHAIDGVGITRIIKEDEQTRSVPVLLATAHAMSGDREALLDRSGADGYIAKPIGDHQVLLGQIASLLGRTAKH